MSYNQKKKQEGNKKIKQESSPDIELDEAVFQGVNLKLLENHRNQLNQNKKENNHIQKHFRRL